METRSVSEASSSPSTPESRPLRPRIWQNRLSVDQITIFSHEYAIQWRLPKGGPGGSRAAEQVAGRFHPCGGSGARTPLRQAARQDIWLAQHYPKEGHRLAKSCNFRDIHS
jgi:hypothetical protein